MNRFKKILGVLVWFGWFIFPFVFHKEMYALPTSMKIGYIVVVSLSFILAISEVFESD